MKKNYLLELSSNDVYGCFVNNSKNIYENSNTKNSVIRQDPINYKSFVAFFFDNELGNNDDYLSQFDIIVTTNMFGDILSDLATELSGSLGLAGSLNASQNQAMAQAQHGSANDIAGKNTANPISLILSASMLLNWLGEKRKLENFILASSLINNSVIKLLENDSNLTKDLGGTASTQEITKKLINILNHYI